MHRKFGRLPWATILKPAIEYARNGFPVSEQVAFDWDFYGRNYRDQSANFRAGLYDRWPDPGQGRSLPQSATGCDARRRLPRADAMPSTRERSRSVIDAYLQA
jgi:hypothetical protein